MHHFPVALVYHAAEIHFSFPQNPAANEQIALRWLHLVSGIIWLGLLYFFNLIGFPTMRQLEGPVRAKVFSVMMPRAMWWFRWSALVTVLVGMRYFAIILAADAQNSGNPALAWRWFGGWFLVWLAAYAAIYPFQLPAKGMLDNPWVRTIAIAAIIIAASWIVLESERAHAGIQQSSGHQCGRRARAAHAAQCLGRRLASAKASDRLDARQRPTGNAAAS